MTPEERITKALREGEQAMRELDACAAVVGRPRTSSEPVHEAVRRTLDRYRSELLRLRDVVGEVDAQLINEALKEL